MSRLRSARKAWDGQPPAWVEVLAQSVDRGKSLGELAGIVGYSKTALSQILTNKYPGNLGRIGLAIETHLAGATVICPLLGEILVSECDANQAREFSAASSARVALWKACRKCEHNTCLNTV